MFHEWTDCFVTIAFVSIIVLCVISGIVIGIAIGMTF